jgi:hypothetical protein
VFFSEEVLVDAPVERTCQRLTSWLAVGASGTAAADALAAGARVLPRAGFAGVGKTVEVRTMQPQVRAGVTVIPLRWSATGPLGELFPTLDANLEISATDAGQSRVALIGSYRPPLGRVGLVLDQAVLHTAGRVTVRRWLRRARAEVNAADPASVPTADVPTAQVPIAEVPITDVPTPEVPITDVPIAGWGPSEVRA